MAIGSDASAKARFNRDVKNAIEALEKRLNVVEGKTKAGLLAAGLLVLGKSQRQVPRETSNLIGSGYSRPSIGAPMSVDIGYSAAYALYVHEAVAMKLKGKPRKSKVGVYWGPAGKAKFLEDPLRQSADEIVKTVRAYARRKT